MRKNLLLLFTLLSIFQSLQAQFVLKDAFPALTFAAPTELTGAGDGSNRLFVVTKGGIIYVMPNVPTATPTVFLNMSARVNTASERGLLGLAFHPNYKQNGYFYISYNQLNGARVISRFKVSATNPNVADPSSELVLLTYTQRFANHNGGKIAFGKDGYLYIATGDGGSRNDPDNNAQNLAVLLGKMLRIDVNRTSPGLNYAIPADNPFINVPGARKEIFAYGLRNPWKFSVDPVTGLIVLGDVGQGQREEINVIIKGGNYGWRIKEGSLCYLPPAPNTDCNSFTNLIPPIYEYDRSQGSSVTGGYVYRGVIPYLYGKYIYGDFVSGNIWVGSANLANSTVTNEFLQKLPGQISSFGEDDQRELYVCNYANGKIYKFTDEASLQAYVSNPSNGGILTGITLYLNTVPGATSYTVQVSTSADFTTGVITKTTASRLSTGTYYASFPELMAGQTYFARVQTNLSLGFGRITTFTTATASQSAYVSNPGNGGILTGITLYLNTVPGATSYTVQVSTSADFTTGVITKTTASRLSTGTYYASFPELMAGQTYFARVQTNLSLGFGRITTFTTATASQSAYVSNPGNGGILTGITLYLNTVPGAASYTVQVSTSADFTTGVITKTTTSRLSTGTYYASFPELTAGQTYFARVQTNLSTDWGRTTTFTTATASQSAYIGNPGNGGILTGITLYLNTVPGATSYTVQVSTSADFTTGVITKTTASRLSTGTYYATFPELMAGQTYYARVQTNLSPNWGRTTSFTKAGSSMARIASGEEVNQAYGYKHLRVYPNPFSGYINLQIGTQQAPVTIRIANLQGVVVFESSGNFSNEEVKLGETLPTGTYILQVIEDKKISTHRIVKAN